MNDDQLLATLLDFERQGWAALSNGTGDQFYGRVMTEDALMIMANGQVMTRAEVIGALAGAPAWSSFDLSDERLVKTGDDGAALIYTGSATRDPNSPAFVAAMASTYVRVDGEWKLALYVQTPVAQD